MNKQKIMYTIERIKNNIAERINIVLGQDVVLFSDITYPNNPEFGDLSLPMFALTKKLGISMGDISGKIIAGLQNSEDISAIKAVGPYINFTLKNEYLAKNVITEINDKKDAFGLNESYSGQKVMVEYSNANTHKEYHVGHLRNLCFGDSVSRLLTASGADVKPISYINDFGIHVAKTIWAYLEFYKDETLPENKGYFLGQVYVRASREMEENKVAKGLVGLIMSKIESREGEEYALWQKTRQWSIDQLSQIYKEIGVKINNKETLYESDFIDSGRQLVDELIEKGILVKSQGAVIADLEAEKLGVLMFLRSDGTALYPVADLSLAKAKFDRFGLTKSIYVVDVRQGLNFKQLFSVLHKMGYDQEMVHLGYDFVKTPGGMMSSRTGNVITYEEIKTEAMSRAVAEIAKRHDDWSDDKIQRVAWSIVLGAIKFEMLKVGSDQVITFDYDNALRFDGYTSAYLQYTAVRINSIIKKVGSIDIVFDYTKLVDPREHILLLQMSKYPEIVKQASDKYNPSEVAKYLFDLARDFNDYYHAVSVVNSEDDVKIMRIAMLKVIRQVIENGLDLLGITIPEEM